MSISIIDFDISRLPTNTINTKTMNEGGVIPISIGVKTHASLDFLEKNEFNYDSDRL
jgi:hypothetical protein